MAAKSEAVWAIDIGSNSLKALHLTAESGTAEVTGFANIKHGKILTGEGVTDAEREELVAISLRQFVNQNELGNDDTVISVPSQNSFARFVNLPPVEPKRIPEIVRFEAVQQIPFDINDVQWDWQLMEETKRHENRVGIFAIKNEVVMSTLEHFSGENMQVGYVQMAPMALYNYIAYDRPELCSSDTQATVILNIGAENTDLVVCTKSSVWQRCILIGGNAFTRAIGDAFKLNFEKAEKLKRTAPMSKYARQLFQAMRPVFTDLASEVQRSLGFYSSSNPDTKLARVVALGGGTRLRGLLKYLEQTLRIPVERPDSFKSLTVRSDVSAVKFHESVCDFGVAYGLGLQGLGLARIESNLLPRSIARSMAWASKAKYFTIAASVVLVVSVLAFARTLIDKASYSSKAPVRKDVSDIIQRTNDAITKRDEVKKEDSAYQVMMQKEFDLFNYRGVVPRLHETIISALPNAKNNPGQAALYEAFAGGDVEEVLKVPRQERKQIFITAMSVYFGEDLASAPFGSGGFMARRATKMTEQMYEDVVEQIGEGFEEIPEDWDDADEEMTEPGEEPVPGFVVTVAGYSPYGNIRELMDPVGVEDDPSKWGFITRLIQLNDVNDSNYPFTVYKPTEIRHFRLEIGEVDLRARMPGAIGTQQFRFVQGKGIEGRRVGERILTDPMTQEIISKVTVFDDNGRLKLDPTGKALYEVKDHWFVLNIKFAWNDAPKAPEEQKQGSGGLQAAASTPAPTTVGRAGQGTQTHTDGSKKTVGLQGFE